MLPLSVKSGVEVPDRNHLADRRTFYGHSFVVSVVVPNGLRVVCAQVMDTPFVRVESTSLVPEQTL